MADKYRVTDVNERRRFTRAGKETLEFVIHIETEKGSVGSIRVPVAEYVPEKVKELLTELQEMLDFAFEL